MAVRGSGGGHTRGLMSYVFVHHAGTSRSNATLSVLCGAQLVGPLLTQVGYLPVDCLLFTTRGD